MRDPNRIPELSRLLELAWTLNPDMRLGQLVVVALRPSVPCPQIFSAEESRLRKGLKRLIEQGSPAPANSSEQECAAIEWEPLAESVLGSVRFLGARLGDARFGGESLAILEVGFGGEYPPGSAGNGCATAMAAKVAGLLRQAYVDVVLVDLSALRYSWGNSLLKLVEVVREFDRDEPLDLVVRGGPESAPALRSLGVSVCEDHEAALAEACRLGLRRAIAIG